MSVRTEPVSRRSQGLRVEGIALQTSLLACGRAGTLGPGTYSWRGRRESSVWPRFWAVRVPVGRLERVFAESGMRSRRIPDSAFSPPRRSGSLNSAVSYLGVRVAAVRTDIEPLHFVRRLVRVTGSSSGRRSFRLTAHSSSSSSRSGSPSASTVERSPCRRPQVSSTVSGSSTCSMSCSTSASLHHEPRRRSRNRRDPGSESSQDDPLSSSYVDSVYVVDVTIKRMSYHGCTFTQSATSPSASAYGNSAATPGSRSPPSPLAPTSRPRSSPISSTIGRFRRSNDCNASPRRSDLTPAVCCPAFGDSAIRRFGPAESPSVRSCGDYLQQPFTATILLHRRQRNSAWSPLSRIRRSGQRDDRKVWGQGAV
jgi:hypothetical protein